MTPARCAWAAVLMAAVLTSGCFVEVSTDGSGTLASADEIASVIELQFAAQTTGATADVDCPSGLSGEPGHEFTCAGRTSDGFSLAISVWEQGEGAFRWLITDSPRTAAHEG